MVFSYKLFLLMICLTQLSGSTATRHSCLLSFCCAQRIQYEPVKTKEAHVSSPWNICKAPYAHSSEVSKHHIHTSTTMSSSSESLKESSPNCASRILSAFRTIRRTKIFLMRLTFLRLDCISFSFLQETARTCRASASMARKKAVRWSRKHTQRKYPCFDQEWMTICEWAPFSQYVRG